MTRITFKADFNDGLSISSVDSSETPQYIGRFHKLTPKQFDALVGAFNGSGTATLTTDGKYGPPRTFRHSTINLGGMETSIYADVESTVLEGQLSLLV